MKIFCGALMALAFAGAALSADKKETAPAQRFASTSPANAAANTKVEVTYFPADSPSSESGLLKLKEWNYLELIAEAIQTSIRLPKPLKLVGQSCGERNALPDQQGSSAARSA